MNYRERREWLLRQRKLANPLPDHDGVTYVPSRDKLRLNAQQERVYSVMADGNWHTLPEIAERIVEPEASISARIRDFRKKKFGGFIVEREYVSNGLFRYRLVTR